MIKDLRNVAQYLDASGEFHRSAVLQYSEHLENFNGHCLDFYIDMYPIVGYPIEPHDYPYTRPFIGYCYHFVLYQKNNSPSDGKPFSYRRPLRLFKFRILDDFVNNFIKLLKPSSNTKITLEDSVVIETENNDDGIYRVEEQIDKLINSADYNNLIKNNIRKLMVRVI